jgi:hypothetical protein
MVSTCADGYQWLRVMVVKKSFAAMAPPSKIWTLKALVVLLRLVLDPVPKALITVLKVLLLVLAPWFFLVLGILVLLLIACLFWGLISGATQGILFWFLTMHRYLVLLERLRLRFRRSHLIQSHSPMLQAPFKITPN